MSPVFAHGQLRLYLLSVLESGPKHGYEVIRDLQDRFDGLYTPSAGTVYPRLARLEDEGLVAREGGEDDSARKVYVITDAGRAEVERRRDEVAALDVDLDASVRRLAEDVRDRVRTGSKDLRGELAAAAKEARASSRPTGGPAGGRTSSPLGPDLDRALKDLRDEVSRSLRAVDGEALSAHARAVVEAATAEVRKMRG